MKLSLKRILFFTFTMILSSILLSGCKQSPPNEEKIAQDIPLALKNLTVDNEIYELDVVSIEIEKRQTNEKDDLVYFQFEMNHGAYTVTGGYAFYYIYYDEGGWILEGTQEYGEMAITYEGETSPLETDLDATSWELDQALHYYDTVAQTACWKNGPASYTYTYDVAKSLPYQSKAGTITLTYTLTSDYWLDYHWERAVDDSAVSASWDIIGTWQGTISDDETIVVTVDSFDPITQIIHISKVTDTKIGIFGGTYVDEREDFWIEPYMNSGGIRMSTTSNQLVYEFSVIMGNASRGLVFEPDKVRVHGTYLTLYPLTRIELLPNQG